MTIEIAWSPGCQSRLFWCCCPLTDVVGHPSETRGEEKLPLVSTHTELVHCLVEHSNLGHEGGVDTLVFGKGHVLRGVIENGSRLGIGVDGQILGEMLLPGRDGRVLAVGSFLVFVFVEERHGVEMLWEVVKADTDLVEQRNDRILMTFIKRKMYSR